MGDITRTLKNSIGRLTRYNIIRRDRQTDNTNCPRTEWWTNERACVCLLQLRRPRVPINKCHADSTGDHVADGSAFDWRRGESEETGDWRKVCYQVGEG